jgi:hypothetical protein
VFRISGNTFYDRKNKIPMRIPEFKRSGIGLIAEFRGVPNGFPNQDNSLGEHSALLGQLLVFDHSEDRNNLLFPWE